MGSEQSSDASLELSPKALCLKPKFRINFSKVAEVNDADQIDDASFVLRVLDPSSGSRFELKMAEPKVDVLHVLALLTGCLGHEAEELSFKQGVPTKGSFAATHPGWDERIRTIHKEGSVVAYIYLYDGERVADATVNEFKMEEYKAYPYF